MAGFRDKIVALDCEMVGVGRYGRDSVLARACVVSGHGEVIIDEYCSSQYRITDYRTPVSGIEEKHMKNAQPFSALQEKVKNAIAGKIVVGHGLEHDFAVLKIDHQEKMKRDTAEFFRGKFTHAHDIFSIIYNTGNKRPALKTLARDQLGREIQNGAHSPAIDAKTALDIYLKNREEWEATVALGSLSISRQVPREYELDDDDYELELRYYRDYEDNDDDDDNDYYDDYYDYYNNDYFHDQLEDLYDSDRALWDDDYFF